ncbi:MAG: hypothetical protein J6J35_07030 [Alphaproteobacteria bacterium]|nr:hypothetical protein [Alphaproteobacteria bacterium]MBP3688096.1 hypothetical protein [Alphaproteobacteria bacterium]
MKKFKLIIPYVVGSFLTFPIVIYHYIHCEEKDKPRHKFPRKIFNGFLKKNNGSPKSSAVKRTCGQSQRELRMARPENPAQNS